MSPVEGEPLRSLVCPLHAAPRCFWSFIIVTWSLRTLDLCHTAKSFLWKRRQPASQGINTVNLSSGTCKRGRTILSQFIRVIFIKSQWFCLLNISWIYLLLYQSESSQEKTISKYFQREVLYRKSIVDDGGDERPNRKQSSSLEVSHSRKSQSTLGWRDKRRKWGSQGPGWGPWAEARIGACSHAKKEMQQLLEVSPGRVKYTEFFFPPASQSPARNYQWPKLIRNQPTWKASKGSPEKSTLPPPSTGTLPWLGWGLCCLFLVLLQNPCNHSLDSAISVSLHFILCTWHSDVAKIQIYKFRSCLNR